MGPQHRALCHEQNATLCDCLDADAQAECRAEHRGRGGAGDEVRTRDLLLGNETVTHDAVAVPNGGMCRTPFAVSCRDPNARGLAVPIHPSEELALDRDRRR